MVRAKEIYLANAIVWFNVKGARPCGSFYSEPYIRSLLVSPNMWINSSYPMPLQSLLWCSAVCSIANAFPLETDADRLFINRRLGPGLIYRPIKWCHTRSRIEPSLMPGIICWNLTVRADLNVLKTHQKLITMPCLIGGAGTNGRWDLYLVSYWNLDCANTCGKTRDELAKLKYYWT